MKKSKRTTARRKAGKRAVVRASGRPPIQWPDFLGPAPPMLGAVQEGTFLPPAWSSFFTMTPQSLAQAQTPKPAAPASTAPPPIPSIPQAQAQGDFNALWKQMGGLDGMIKNLEKMQKIYKMSQTFSPVLKLFTKSAQPGSAMAEHRRRGPVPKKWP
ncbi:hypothetical protein [Paenibacillus gansuensis]|uniref:Uncharacterized protein n=1 Tax=Paenibacillus gansuensis TaxID=306542 RepID=A0ABW5PJC4_9BACL